MGSAPATRVSTATPRTSTSTHTTLALTPTPTSRVHAARDEMRLSAMLFALYLNAAVADGGDADEEEEATGAVRPSRLSWWRLGDAELHFCVQPARRLLLVLVTDAALGSAPGAFLAAELLRRFDDCFDAVLTAAGTPATAPRSSLRRQSFAPSLLGALQALPPWMMDRMGRHEQHGGEPSLAASCASVDPLTASGGKRVRLTALTALHAPELCVLLAQPPPAPPPVLQPQPPLPSLHKSPRGSKYQSRLQVAPHGSGGGGGGGGVGTGAAAELVEAANTAAAEAAAAAARDPAWDAVVAPLADAAAAPPHKPRGQLSSPSSPPPVRGGCFGCFGEPAKGTARRPAPKRPSPAPGSAPPAPPLVFAWRLPPSGPGAPGASPPASLSPSLSPVATAQHGGAGGGIGGSSGSSPDMATLHRLLYAAQQAWRGHCTHVPLAAALVLEQGDVLLLRTPLLLFASVDVELPVGEHEAGGAKAAAAIEGRHRLVAANVAAAVHPWARPLSLVLAFLHRIRPSLEPAQTLPTTSTTSSTKK